MPPKPKRKEPMIGKRRQDKVRKNTNTLKRKIGNLSEVTGLWTVYLSYDPIQKKHLTLISTPRHSQSSSEESLIQDAISELSTWPKEGEIRCRNNQVDKSFAVDDIEDDESVEAESVEVNHNVDNNSWLVHQQLQSPVSNTGAGGAILDGFEQPEERQLPSLDRPVSMIPTARYFNNQKYSDATIYLGKSKTPLSVHRIFLDGRSSYLDNIFQSKLQVYFEDSARAHWRLFQYLYTGDYSEESTEGIDTDDDDLEAMKHLEVYQLAHTFHIEDLKQVSWEKFIEQGKTRWIGDSFTCCVREVYAASQRVTRARKIIVDILVSYKKELSLEESIEALRLEVEEFREDLFLELRRIHFSL